ncbi:MAG TPA: hypothetical protein VM557_08765, partial [Thermoanaerobaculia bacterium]|nr:hypothetical protein [Thermoanaerobaculia bacterium]
MIEPILLIFAALMAAAPYGMLPRERWKRYAVWDAAGWLAIGMMAAIAATLQLPIASSLALALIFALKL